MYAVCSRIPFSRSGPCLLTRLNIELQWLDLTTRWGRRFRASSWQVCNVSLMTNEWVLHLELMQTTGFNGGSPSWRLTSDSLICFASVAYWSKTVTSFPCFSAHTGIDIGHVSCVLQVHRCHACLMCLEIWSSLASSSNLILIPAEVTSDLVSLHAWCDHDLQEIINILYHSFPQAESSGTFVTVATVFCSALFMWGNIFWEHRQYSLSYYHILLDSLSLPSALLIF